MQETSWPHTGERGDGDSEADTAEVRPGPHLTLVCRVCLLPLWVYSHLAEDRGKLVLFLKMPASQNVYYGVLLRGV
jgi:hypothetical protein